MAISALFPSNTTPHGLTGSITSSRGLLTPSDPWRKKKKTGNLHFEDRRHHTLGSHKAKLNLGFACYHVPLHADRSKYWLTVG